MLVAVYTSRVKREGTYREPGLAIFEEPRGNRFVRQILHSLKSEKRTSSGSHVKCVIQKEYGKRKNGEQ